MFPVSYPVYSVNCHISNNNNDQLVGFEKIHIMHVSLGLQ